MANEKQAATERRFKKLFKGFEMPAAPAPPANLPPDRREVWQLQQEVKLLRDRYNMLVKITWRTSAALVGLAAPAFGWDFISKVLDVLGVK
jgi:hypothetical protein